MDGQYYKIVSELKKEKAAYIREQKQKSRIVFTDTERQIKVVAMTQWIEKRLVNYEI